MAEHTNYSNCRKNSLCELTNSKTTVTVVHVTEDHLKPNNRPRTRPPVPTVQDTILIPSRANVKPSIPTVNETVLLDKQYNQSSSIKQLVDTKLVNRSVEERNSDNVNVTAASLFIVKKQKERCEKNKSHLLEKQKFLEDKKRRLDQLQKTTREIARSCKKSKKQKTIAVDSENKCDKSLPIETYQPKLEIKTIDQTWSPPQSPRLTLPKSRKKSQKTPTKVNRSKFSNINSDASKNITKTASSCARSMPQSSIIVLEKSTPVREVAKPENIYSKLKLNECYLLTDNDTYDRLRPKTICVDSLLAPKDDEKLNREMSDINVQRTNSTNVSTEAPTGLQRLPDRCNEKMCCSNGNKELFFDNLLPNKTIDSRCNVLSRSPESLSTLAMNSVLECKNGLPLNDKNDLKLYKPEANLCTNEVSNCANKNVTNNVESVVFNVLDLECSDSVAHELNLDPSEAKNRVSSNTFLFEDENTNSSANAYKDIERVMKKIDYDLEFVTKNNYSSDRTGDKINACDHFQFENASNLDLDSFSKNNNNKSNDVRYHGGCLKLGENNSIIISPSSCSSNLHDEFQAELDMLDQLNDSLRSIEKMDCDSSIKNDKQTVDNKPNDHDSTNVLNSKTIFNSTRSDVLPTYRSKLNVLSSSTMSVDKTITNFSILMFEQLIRDEELKAKQHLTINGLKEKSLANQLTWEATMCDLQATFRNGKNSLGHLHEFQTFKQQHRGKLKKLENSLSQVKRLGRVIDSVYKRRVVMLEEHLQYLRMQSSSKKVIRKLNSLDHVPKKEKNESEPSNVYLANKHSKTNSVGMIECKTVHKNYSKPSVPSENNTSPTVCQTDKPKTILRNQATSPINIETENSQPVQTVIENSYIDKSVQTSKTSLYCSGNFVKNKTSFDPVDDLSSQNKLSDVNITTNIDNNKAVYSILSKSPVEMMHCHSESSVSTNSEQGEMDARITTLQERLEARKIECSRLKKKQKKLKLESLKAKERDILKQIEIYDKQIEESKRTLMIEIEKKSRQVKNGSIKRDSSSKHSVIDGPNNDVEDERRTLARHGQNVSDEIKCNICRAPQDKLMCELQRKVTAELKENLVRFANNVRNSEMSSQYSETSQANGVDLSRKCVSNRTKKNIVPCNPQSEDDVLMNRPLNDCENDLRPETCSSETNKLLNTCDRPEKSTRCEKFTTSYENMNDDRLSTISSKSGTLQEELFLDLNKTDLSEEINCGVTRLNAWNNGPIIVKSVNDYGPGFTSDGCLPECHESYENNDNVINVPNNDQDDESSYEEDRSEGDVMFEDKMFIEQHPGGNDSFQVEKPSDDRVDVVTDNIFNNLVEDMKNTIKINKRQPSSVLANDELDNLTEETPLLMNLKSEEERRNKIVLSEQAKSISDVLFKCNLQQIVCESLRMYLPKLNVTEVEKLKLYLRWSSSRKKVKLSDYLKCQHKTSHLVVDSDESFKMFYQKHQKQKTSLTVQDESGEPTRTVQKVQKLKDVRSAVKNKIERLHVTEESKPLRREIPNKPPPPYKSPTKKKALDDMPYSLDKVRATVSSAAAQLFSDPRCSMSKDSANDSDSIVCADYKTLLFDYCKEIAQDMFFVEEKVPIWQRPKKKFKHFQGRPKDPEELCDAVLKKLNQIKEVDDCEEKVNAFVIKQMYEEDSKWVDFQTDEMNVQNDVVNSLMNKLICDTVKNMKTNFCLKFM